MKNYKTPQDCIQSISENINIIVKKTIIPSIIKYQQSVQLALNQCKNHGKTRA